MIGETNEASGLTDQWTAADLQWLATNVPMPLQATAKKYGRLCFSLTMHAGAISAALSNIAGVSQQFGPHGKIIHGQLQILAGITNDMLNRLLTETKITQETFQACKKDIDLLGALISAAPPAAVGGRIILPS